MATRNAGSCDTRPSPIDSSMKVFMASAASQPSWNLAMAKPPTMLMMVMMMPAIASPRTNLEAPSMAP